ncbi:MAG: hypothetical protein AB1916_13340 [Thermodesulfobacteriota bacterium]
MPRKIVSMSVCVIIALSLFVGLPRSSSACGPCGSPDFMAGLWQKWVDGNTIQVYPGSLSVSGAMLSLMSAANCTLSGNLRTGESEAANRYYYLYVVNVNCSPIFKFSELAPARDVWGNVSGIEDGAGVGVGLYHPVENGWRYIGQVYNDASGSIMPFAKCYPGYWESEWTFFNTTGGVYISHALGALPKKSMMLFKSSLGDSSFVMTPYGSPGLSPTFGSSPRQWGGQASNTQIGWQFMDYVFDWGGTWRTSGYYKLILSL